MTLLRINTSKYNLKIFLTKSYSSKKSVLVGFAKKERDKKKDKDGVRG